MQTISTLLPGVVVIETKAFGDPRGFFMEAYHAERYREAGLDVTFVQDNLSFSRRGTLRGLHFQSPQPQGKLVCALNGEVFDVAVDIRPDSSTFGRWVGVTLSAENHRQLYIPPGFAHGFCVTSESAHVLYKCTDFYNPAADGGVLWNDPDLGIAWPVREPILSDKDARAPRLKDVPREKLTLPPSAAAAGRRAARQPAA